MRTFVKNIIYVIASIVVSVAIFNAAEASDIPITIRCYSGGEVVHKGSTHKISYMLNNMLSYYDLSGVRHVVPKAMCVVNYGRNN